MTELQEFFPAALRAAERVWPTLPAPLQALLGDLAGGVPAARKALATHVLEVLRAEAWLSGLGGTPPAPEGPVALALAEFAEREACLAAARELPAPPSAPAAEVAEALFEGSTSRRARKRRGGVYTRRALVEHLLELSRWGEPGGPRRLWEPAVGAGAFLVGAWERALDLGHDPAALRPRLFGSDIHPYAVHAARFALALAAHARGLDPALAPLVRCEDALERADDPPVDLVIGNPPWVRGERIPLARRRDYKARFPEVGRGNSDLATYFIAAAWRRLESGGRLALVLSQGVVDAASTAGVRAQLGPGLEALVGLEWGPRAFPEANVVPCLLVASRSPADAPVRLAQTAAREGEPLSWSEVSRPRWSGLSATRWAIHVRDADLDLLEALRRAPRGLSARYGLAVRTRVGAQTLIASGEEPPAEFTAPRPLRDGRDVAAWAAEPIGRWIDYRPEAISDPKREESFRGPKVLVPRIALTPQAFVDETDALYRNTLMLVRGPLPPHALAAVLNGLPLRYYAFHLQRAGVLASSHRCTLYAGAIADLPLPAAALEDPALAERLAELGRDCANLARLGAGDLSAAERELDELLAEAYGLEPATLSALRRRARAEPLSRVLRPARLGDRRRKIGVQAFAPGARYA